jgi:gliding motility-associated-like protein
VHFTVLGGNGIIAATVDGVAIVNGQAVEDGKTVVFTATPNADYMVEEWSINGADPGHISITHTLVLVENVDVTVSFALQPDDTHIVNFDVDGENGSITASVEGVQIDNGAAVLHGHTVVFTAVPDVDYMVNEWMVNGSVQEDQFSNIFTINVTEPLNVIVSFIEEHSVDPIIAVDDNVELEKNSSIIIDVLTNDEGVEEQTVTVTIVGNPFNGVAMVNANNTIEYVSNYNYVGLDSLTYQVCGDGENCDQAMVRINVTDIIPDKLRIPEGFSPDGDGINDNFEIIGLEYFGRVTLKVYNRWGNLIYKSDNYKNDWDGVSNTSMSVGKTLPNGTYYYILDVVSSNKRYTGNVFLKR